LEHRRGNGTERLEVLASEHGEALGDDGSFALGRELGEHAFGRHHHA
jgi:hypothetical protein